MSYSFKGRVRYSEIGEDGCLTLPGIQNYYQDCCTFQSENIGQGMKALEERQRAWVLSSWQIVVNRYPGLGETIVASTAPYGFKGFLGMRNFTLKTEDGELLSYANSIWTNIISKGTPSSSERTAFCAETAFSVSTYTMKMASTRPEIPNWMKSWRWIMRPVRLPFRKGWKPRSLLQYRNIIWTPITMLIIVSISAWGQTICQKALKSAR